MAIRTTQQTLAKGAFCSFPETLRQEHLRSWLSPEAWACRGALFLHSVHLLLGWLLRRLGALGQEEKLSLVAQGPHLLVQGTNPLSPRIPDGKSRRVLLRSWRQRAG